MTDTHKKLAEEVKTIVALGFKTEAQRIVAEQAILALLASEFARGRAQGAHEAADTVYLASKDYSTGKGDGCWEERCKDGSCNLCIIKRCEKAASAYPKPDAKKL